MAQKIRHRACASGSVRPAHYTAAASQMAAALARPLSLSGQVVQVRKRRREVGREGGRRRLG